MAHTSNRAKKRTEKIITRYRKRWLEQRKFNEANRGKKDLSDPKISEKFLKRLRKKTSAENLVQHPRPLTTEQKK